MAVWLIGQSGPAWMEGRFEVPFWIPGLLLGVIMTAALLRLAWRATEERGREG
jgi:hypothetical protein